MIFRIYLTANFEGEFRVNFEWMSCECRVNFEWISSEFRVKYNEFRVKYNEFRVNFGWNIMNFEWISGQFRVNVEWMSSEFRVNLRDWFRVKFVGINWIQQFSNDHHKTPTINPEFPRREELQGSLSWGGQSYLDSFD